MTGKVARGSRLLVPVLLVLTVAASPARADGVVGVQVEDDTLHAKIRLSGGIGADLSVRFEGVVGLSEANLGLSARLLDAAELASIQARLPSSLVSVPSGFPVLLTVEPPSAGGLSFTGVATVELYTHDLLYVPGSPLRLFAAPLGGAFEDVTSGASGGSYRVRGRKGDFSEFLIVADLRPVADVTDAKLTRLKAVLTGNSTEIDPTLLGTLLGLFDEAESAYDADDFETAIDKVEELADTVEEHGGDGIPNVWRSARDLINVAGLARAAAATLRFHLILEANGVS